MVALLTTVVNLLTTGVMKKSLLITQQASGQRDNEDVDAISLPVEVVQATQVLLSSA